MRNADIKNLQENESVVAEVIFLSAQLMSHRWFKKKPNTWRPSLESRGWGGSRLWASSCHLWEAIIKEIFEAHSDQKLNTFLHKTRACTLLSFCILW